MMTTQRFGEPWSGTTYNGFAGTAPGAAHPEASRGESGGLYIERPPQRQFEPREYRGVRRARRATSPGMLVAGVGVGGAVALGLIFGLVAKPDLAGDAPAPAPMQAVTAAAPAQPAASPGAQAQQAPPTSVPVEVAEAPTASVRPSPAPAGKLEVLPPDLARAARASAPVRIAPPPRNVAVIEAPPASRPIAPPAPVIEAPARIAATAPEVSPSFNCRYAGTPSERMVCNDPELAQLDRRLDSAFNRAVASGVPYRELRAEQDDWLAIREDAARRSSYAVASIYRQRIEELNALAQ